MHEEWKPVVGYESCYEVSNRGQVRHVRRPDKTLKLCINRFGYAFVSLSRFSKQKRVRVHRLVLDAFAGPKPDLACNHINFDRADNRLENLEWVTTRENVLHTAKAGRMRNLFGIGEAHNKVVLTEKDVIAIRERFTKGEVNKSKLAREYGVDHTTICAIVNRKTWRHVA